MSDALDPRLNAFRPDLADARLKGQVTAARYVEGRLQSIIDPVVDLRRAPRPDAGVDTQLILGDDVRVFEETEGWAWAQGVRDGYVGYLSGNALGDMRDNAAGGAHCVAAPRTFVFDAPDLKTPAQTCLSMGSRVHVTGQTITRGTSYAQLDDGRFCFAGHLRPADAHAGDFVAVAETLTHAPYLWGGTSGFAVDCSGLVQLAMRMAGRTVLRDTDMQAATIGTALALDTPLQRGDLVFWTGHVGIMSDAVTLLHANGASMDVRAEPLAEAIARIAPHFGQPTGFRRPD